MSTISAGTTSTTTLIATGDTTGSLVFKTNDTGSGGTTAMTIDTSQNVGIGVTPSTKLDVSGPSGNTSFTGTNAMAITVRGSTSSTDYSAIDFRSSSANSGSTAIGRIGVVAGGAGSSMSFGTSNSYVSGITNTAMTIDPSGNLLVNKTSGLGSAKFVVEADTTTVNPMTVSNSRSTAATDYSVLFYRNASIVGSIQTSLSATSYVTSSDYRLKENIAPMTGALSAVARLKPVTYTWKLDGAQGQGFIAHELQEVVPDCVTGEKDAVDTDGNPVYQGIDTSFLVATLTAAIQEQQTLITQLTERISALENK